MLPIATANTDDPLLLPTSTIFNIPTTTNTTTNTTTTTTTTTISTTQVSFTIVFAEGKLAEVQGGGGGVYKKMKLESTMSTTNMNLFNSDCQIVKYDLYPSPQPSPLPTPNSSPLPTPQPSPTSP